MKKTLTCYSAVLVTTALVLSPALAQTADHGEHAGHGGAAAARPAGNDATAPMQHMDHGEMQMQGNSAPPSDARDPHEYSGGYTRNAGQYALPPEHRLSMADEHRFASVLADKFEYVYTDAQERAAYDAQAWFGTTYDRLVLKAEGEVSKSKLDDARTELLWGHAIANYWDTQLGLRYDGGEGPDRTWLAFGIQGLAPYWFELDATAYVGENGRSALRLSAEYELLLTQKLILQPSIEVKLYGKEDEQRGIGRGLSDASLGLRLRYEITRQFAPYIGVVRAKEFGDTADLARDDGQDTAETRWVAGVRFWF